MNFKILLPECLLTLLLALFCNASLADIWKCSDGHGAVTYTDVSCVNGMKEVQVFPGKGNQSPPLPEFSTILLQTSDQDDMTYPDDRLQDDQSAILPKRESPDVVTMRKAKEASLNMEKSKKSKDKLPEAAWKQNKDTKDIAPILASKRWASFIKK